MVLEVVRDCLVNALALDETEASEVTEATAPSDLQKWDSVGHLMLIVELEERFEVEFSDDETITLTSVGAILQVIGRKQQGIGSSAQLAAGG